MTAPRSSPSKPQGDWATLVVLGLIAVVGFVAGAVITDFFLSWLLS